MCAGACGCPNPHAPGYGLRVRHILGLDTAVVVALVAFFFIVVRLVIARLWLSFAGVKLVELVKLAGAGQFRGGSCIPHDGPPNGRPPELMRGDAASYRSSSRPNGNLS